MTTNLVLQARWFGPVLFFLTHTHLHYLTLDGESSALLSLDGIENKNLLSMLLMDRALIVQRSSTATRKKSAAA